MDKKDLQRLRDLNNEMADKFEKLCDYQAKVTEELNDNMQNLANEANLIIDNYLPVGEVD